MNKPATAMQTTKANEASLAESFCHRFGVPREEFVSAMLRRVLYPHARIILGIGSWFSRDALRRDREIVAALGNAHEMRSVGFTISSMPWYYGQSWPFRRWSRLRVSSRRVMSLARSLLAA